MTRAVDNGELGTASLPRERKISCRRGVLCSSVYESLKAALLSCCLF